MNIFSWKKFPVSITQNIGWVKSHHSPYLPVNPIHPCGLYHGLFWHHGCIARTSYAESGVGVTVERSNHSRLLCAIGLILTCRDSVLNVACTRHCCVQWGQDSVVAKAGDVGAQSMWRVQGHHCAAATWSAVPAAVTTTSTNVPLWCGVHQFVKKVRTKWLLGCYACPRHHMLQIVFNDNGEMRVSLAQNFGWEPWQMVHLSVNKLGELWPFTHLVW